MSDYLNLSDEDFLKGPTPKTEVEETVNVESQEPTNEEPNTPAPTTQEPPTNSEGTETSEDDEGSGTTSEDSEKPESQETGQDTKPEASGTSNETAIDYEKEYKRLLAPFKANGRDFSVDNVDDAISLMQMGANYNKKMVGLKPSLKALKILEKNDLLSEEKLSYLVDLANKNPDAINKLIKDSGIDPLTIDIDKAEGYKPNNQTISDSELVLDEVISEIENTPTFNRIANVVTKEWDEESRQVLLKDPRTIKILNDQIGNGIFDRIMYSVNKERTLGRLIGMSDIEAYRQIGDLIQSRNGFADLVGQPNTQSQRSETNTPNPQQGQEDKLNEKRKSLAPTTGGAATRKVDEVINPLSLSDEEFEKRFSGKFLK